MNQAIEQTMKSLISAGSPIVLAVTGAGCKALSWFTLYPGSSNFALEANNLYAQGALHLFLGQKVSKYVCQEVSEQMAQECLIRAHQILRNQDEQDPKKFLNSVGVSLTAAIRSIPDRKGQHHAYASVQFLYRRYTFYFNLEKGIRTREEEDLYISEVLMQIVSDLINNVEPNLPEDVQIIFRDDKQDIFNLLRRDPNKFFNVLCTKDGAIQINTVLENCVIMSGSFNPLHEAHISIAKITADLVKVPHHKIYYELSIINADKGTIDTEQILQRLDQFIPNQMNVILSARPLFRDKNIFLKNGAFSIGADTYKRIIDPKYYNNSPTERDISFIEFLKNNNEIVVAPRVSTTQEKVETLQDFEVPKLIMKHVRELTGFRIDISSTQLREKRAKSLPSQGK